jgi:Transposase and inactivated derivatives, IS1 family
MCVSRRRNLWLWVASSRYTGQILAFALGDRSLDTLEELWERVPDPWRKRLVYSDGYAVYAAFFSAWQHRPCRKGDGGTCTAEGVNNALRHRCGALVRRCCSRPRCPLWWHRRLLLSCHAHNQHARMRWQKQTRLTQSRH